MFALRPVIITFFFSILALTACDKKTATTTAPETQSEATEKSAEAPPASVQEVNVYSYRQEDLIKPLLDQFSAKTGIKVNLVTGKADALLQRLQSEAENSPADILLTSDAGRLYRAKEAGVLQAIDSPVLTQNIPAHLRDKDQQWFGLSQRSRVIFYNKAKVSPDELSTYENLMDEKWRGRICIRSSNNIYNQSLLAAIIAHHDENFALAWAKGIAANMARKPQGGDREQLEAAAIGACDLAIANTYYFGGWLASDDPKILEYASKLGVFFPNQDGEHNHGAHMNISGAGVTKFAKNKANAIQLIEFLSAKDAQDYYAQTNFEYPVNPQAQVSETLKAWGYPFKMDTLNVEQLGLYNPQAIKLFDLAGWE